MHLCVCVWNVDGFIQFILFKSDNNTEVVEAIVILQMWKLKEKVIIRKSGQVASASDERSNGVSASPHSISHRLCVACKVKLAFENLQSH